MFKRIIAVAIIGAALAACGGAQAADQTYKTSDGQAFSLRNVYKIEPGNGDIHVTFANGGDTYYADVGGAVFNKILQNNQQLVQISGTQAVVDPTYAARILCQSGTSRVAIQGSSIIIEAQDGCSMANQAIAKAK